MIRFKTPFLWRVSSLMVYLAFSVLLLSPAFGREGEQKKTRQALLQEINQERQAAIDRADALRREIEALSLSEATLNVRLIETAKRIREGEVRIDAAETRIAELEERESSLRISLGGRRETSGNLFLALERIARRPVPTFLTRPEEALTAIRSAMILEYVLSHVSVDVKELVRDLSEFAALREAIGRERESLVLFHDTLGRERLQIESLLEFRRRALSFTETQLSEIKEYAEKLSKEAKTLEELIARMGGGVFGDELRQEDIGLGTGSKRNTSTFAEAKGMLPMPVHGRIIARFGKPNQSGNSLPGISFSARPGAQVIAPADGSVVYAGSFRSYGQMIILNVGDGYHMVLAGLKKIDVQVGQSVLMGEPVGTMGIDISSAQFPQTGGRQGAPVLYVELRRSGNAIDSAPWWSGLNRKT